MPALLLAILLLLTSTAQAAPRVRLCYNEEMHNSNTATMFFDYLAALRQRLPALEFVTTALPWARCLQLAAQGLNDGVLGGSHSALRARDLVYPTLPDGRLDDSKRMYAIGYVLVRRRGSQLDWDGNRFVHLDGPLGAQQGYSIVASLRQLGYTVDDGAKSVRDTLQKLERGRVAGVLINPLNARLIDNHPSWRQRLEVVPGTRVLQKSYFLILSQHFVMQSPAQAELLWQTIATIRHDKNFIRRHGASLGP